MPAYILLGLTLGPAWVCKWSLVVFFASRISCGQHECSSTTTILNESAGGSGAGGGTNSDEHKVTFCNRNERVRRLARWFHAIQDIGIFIGALIASIIISCAATESNCIFTQKFFKSNNRDNSISNNNSYSGNNTILSTTTDTDKILLNTLNDTHRGIDISHLSSVNFSSNKSKTMDGASSSSLPLAKSTNVYPTTISNDATDENTGYGLSILKFYQETIFSQHDELLDSLYTVNEHGVRICGAGSCPTWNYDVFASNSTEEYNWFTFNGTIPMTLFYIGLALVALVLACLSQHVDNSFKYENFKGVTETLLLASPMAYFIGTEQGYMLGGFTRVSREQSYYFFCFLIS